MIGSAVASVTILGFVIRYFFRVLAATMIGAAEALAAWGDGIRRGFPTYMLSSEARLRPVGVRPTWRSLPESAALAEVGVLGV